MKKHEYTDTIICPHCDETMRDAYDLYWDGFKNDGDSTEIDCGHCEKLFKVTLHISSSYSTIGPSCKVHELVEVSRGTLDSGLPYISYVCRECQREYYDWHLPNGKYSKLTLDQYKIIEEII